MRLHAGRPTAASRAVACSVLSLALSFAAACSSDSPGIVGPTTATKSFEVLDLSSGPVVAEIKSAWLETKCVSVSGGMAEGSRTELEPCTKAASQQFQFSSAGDIRVGGNYCIDVDGSVAQLNRAVIIAGCDDSNSQKWSMNSSGQLRNPSDVCVGFKGHPEDGNSLNTTKCQGEAGQQWVAEALETTPTNPSPAPVATVAVTLSPSTISIGQSAQASAVLKDANGNVLTGRTVTWSSGSTSIASITVAGLISALLPGTSNVVATSEGMTGSASLTVTASGTQTPPPPPPPASCSLVTDMATHSTSPLAKPGYLQSVREPDFGTTITRITGDPGTAIPVVGGTWGDVSGHHYSKDAAWSADQRLIVLTRGVQNSQGYLLFLDGTTYQPLFGRNAPGPEYVWHPTMPDVMIYITSAGGFGQWNVRTNAATKKFSPTGYSNAQLGPSEGNVSQDGRWAVAVATRSSDGHQVAYAVDIDNGVKYPDIDLAGIGVSELDWASISPLGTYVVVHGTIGGTAMTTRVYSRQGQLVTTWPEVSRPTHYDMTVDLSGNEVGVGIVGGSPNSKTILMRRLDSGAATVLTSSSFDAHASTRNNQRPGWAYSSINNTGSPFDREVYAVKMDGSGAVERYAHHRSNVGSDYYSQPQAVPSPDGRRVLFRSNWGGSRPVQDYVVDTRSLCQ